MGHREDANLLHLDAEVGRYTLYVVGACPFAARPWMAVKFYGLEDLVQVVRCFPGSGPDGWFFEPQSDWEKQAVENHPDGVYDAEPHFGAKRVKELYTAIQPDYAGRFSVPLLFDRKNRTIVSNDSMDMAKALCSPHLHSARTRNCAAELLPPAGDTEQTAAHNKLCDELSEEVTNAPYAVLFGGATQQEHERRSLAFFRAMDKYERMLVNSSLHESSRALQGQLRLADIILFNTAVRWDIGYRWRFNIGGDSMHSQRYPAISSLICQMMALDGVVGKDGAIWAADITRTFWSSSLLADAVAKRTFCTPLPPLSGWSKPKTDAIKYWVSGTLLARTATDESMAPTEVDSVSDAEAPMEPRTKKVRCV